MPEAANARKSSHDSLTILQLALVPAFADNSPGIRKWLNDFETTTGTII
jgi:hypothetical protein